MAIILVVILAQLASRDKGGLTTRKGRKMSEKLFSLVFAQQCDSNQDFIKTRGGWQTQRGQQVVPSVSILYAAYLQTPKCLEQALKLAARRNKRHICKNLLWFINRYMHFQWKVFQTDFNLRHLNLTYMRQQKWCISRVNNVNLCKLCDKSSCCTSQFGPLWSGWLLLHWQFNI